MRDESSEFGVVWIFSLSTSSSDAVGLLSISGWENRPRLLSTNTFCCVNSLLDSGHLRGWDRNSQIIEYMCLRNVLNVNLRLIRGTYFSFALHTLWFARRHQLIYVVVRAWLGNCGSPCDNLGATYARQ